MHSLSVALIISTSELWQSVQASLEKLPVRVVLEQPEIGDPVVTLEKIQRMAPDVVFLDLSLPMPAATEFIRLVKSTSSNPEIIAVHAEPDSQMILAAMRAGAREYLYPPLSPALEEALRRIAAERHSRAEGSRSGGKTLGVLAAKGGCGATTLAVHTVIDLQRRCKQECLLMDLDLSSGIIRLLLKSKSRYSVIDALTNVNRLDTSYWKALVSNGVPGLEVISTPVDGYPHEIPTWSNLQHVLRFARSQYGWTVVDLGRGSSCQLFAALEELDELFLVTTLDVHALHQAKQLVECLLRRGYGRNRIRLVLNRMTRRAEVTPSDIQSITGVPVFGILPNDYQGIYEAYAGGELLPVNSSIHRKISSLAAKLMGADEEPRRKVFSLFG